MASAYIWRSIGGAMNLTPTSAPAIMLRFRYTGARAGRVKCPSVLSIALNSAVTQISTT